MSEAIFSRGELVGELQELGVETVTATYDGCGDSGQIEDPEFGSADVPPELAKAVQDLFYDYLEELYGGWEINEGSYGVFEWNIRTNMITLAHNTRSEEYEEREL